MVFQIENSVNQQILLPYSGVELFVKREDQIHPFVSGNKYRKLKYNIIEAKKKGFKTLLTFGGAFSNHIAAVASAGKLFGFKTIGVIRGEELATKTHTNSTLSFALQQDMKLEFLDRESYRNKNDSAFLEHLKAIYGSFYLIPEGGTNALAVKGCEEIILETDRIFDYICTSVGTGGTISGIINASKANQQILGFPALKGDFLDKNIVHFTEKTNWNLIKDYHFGGYAKVNSNLVAFMNQFKKTHNISLDPIYTGKMMFGILDLIKKDYFPKKTKILAVHTGGLQGVSGMNSLLKKKKIPTLD